MNLPQPTAKEIACAVFFAQQHGLRLLAEGLSGGEVGDGGGRVDSVALGVC